MSFLLLIVPVFSTLLGGVLALRFRRSLVVLTALGAGLLLGAAFLDLLPEALATGESIHLSASYVLGLTLLAFLGFLGLQSVLDGAAERWEGSERTLGRIGGGLLIFHSFRDGMAIGLSFAASHPAGYAVAAGIAAHDIADGLNTVILTTGGEKPTRSDYLFLAADCLAPLLGGLLTIFWTFSLRGSVILLATAAGFFIQMAASDFLPGVRKQGRSPHKLYLAVLAGAAIIYLANRLVGYSW